MFHRRTLFIVGAGASAEVNFPVGVALARSIAAKMDIRFEHGVDFVGSGDQNLYNHIVHMRRQDADDWYHAAIRLRDGLPFSQSIDDYLDQHRSDKYVNLYGKAAIVQAVVEAERESKLYFNPFSGDEPFDPNTLADTWLVKFMYMATRGVPRESVTGVFQNVEFIVFNYDRCVEYFLISALERAYAIRREDAIAIIGKLNVLHPYGDIGTLREVPFGADRVNCVAAADRIKTYTEQVDAKGLLSEIDKKVQWAECMVFLGFAFHNQNMRMLRPSTPNQQTKVIYGTAYQMSDADVLEVSNLINRTMAGPLQIHIENKLKCAGLFDYYAKSLTGGD